jgi:hypothetical protein
LCRLCRTAQHTPLANQHAEKIDDPEIDRPMNPEKPHSLARIPGTERCLAVGDRLTTVLKLHCNLEEATEEDDPEHSESRFRPERCRRNEFTRAYDRRRENQPRAQIFER